MVLAVLLVVATASNDRARAAGGSFADVERAVVDAGLQICSTVDDPGGQANQAVASRSYEVAQTCPNDATAQVVADQFADRADRDAAVRNVEVQVRPRASGVAYTYGRLSLFVFGHGDDAVQDRLDDAFQKLGAR